MGKKKRPQELWTLLRPKAIGLLLMSTVKQKSFEVEMFCFQNLIFLIIHLSKTLSRRKALFPKLFLCDNTGMDNTAVDFWGRVKVLIKQRNTTQEGLANTAGLNFSNMKQQIFYKRLPDAAQAVRIAKALQTSVEYLVTGEDTNPLAQENAMLKEKIQKAKEALN